MTPENRRHYCEEMVTRAGEELATADDLVTLKRYNAATSRAYLAMLYAASALLGARDVHRSKHSGVVAAFGEQFAKTRDMDPGLHGILKEAFKSRITCDYSAPYRESREKAEATLADARRFVQAAEERLGTELGAPGEDGPGEGPDGPDA